MDSNCRHERAIRLLAAIGPGCTGTQSGSDCAEGIEFSLKANRLLGACAAHSVPKRALHVYLELQYRTTDRFLRLILQTLLRRQGRNEFHARRLGGTHWRVQACWHKHGWKERNDKRVRADGVKAGVGAGS